LGIARIFRDDFMPRVIKRDLLGVKKERRDRENLPAEGGNLATSFGDKKMDLCCDQGLIQKRSLSPWGSAEKKEGSCRGASVEFSEWVIFSLSEG